MTDPIMMDEVTDGNDVPEIYQKIYSASDIYLEGDFVVIQVNGSTRPQQSLF